MQLKKIMMMLAVAALPAIVFGQSKVATVDMGTVLRSHPKFEENNKALQDMKTGREAELKTASLKYDGLAKKMRDITEKVENTALSEKARSDAREEGRDLAKQLRVEEESFVALKRRMQKSLAEAEVALYSGMIEDATNKIAVIAKERKLDLVLDSSAVSATTMTPMVTWSASSLDITEAVVEKLGGKIVRDRGPETADK